MDRDEILDTAVMEDLIEKAIYEKRSEGGEQSRQSKQQVKGLTLIYREKKKVARVAGMKWKRWKTD